MPTVSISLNGISYPMTCGDGEEGRVRELAGHLDRRMREVARTGAAGRSEAHLLVITAMLMMDDLLNAQNAALNAPAHNIDMDAINAQAQELQSTREQLNQLQQALSASRDEQDKEQQALNGLIGKIDSLIQDVDDVPANGAESHAA